MCIPRTRNVATRRGIACITWRAPPGRASFTRSGATDASPSVAVVSVTRGHESLHDWEKLTTATDTLAIVTYAGIAPPGTGADFNGDGIVNGIDLAVWKSNFGVGSKIGRAHV